MKKNSLKLANKRIIQFVLWISFLVFILLFIGCLLYFQDKRHFKRVDVDLEERHISFKIPHNWECVFLPKESIESEIDCAVCGHNLNENLANEYFNNYSEAKGFLGYNEEIVKNPLQEEVLMVLYAPNKKDYFDLRSKQVKIEAGNSSQADFVSIKNYEILVFKEERGFYNFMYTLMPNGDDIFQVNTILPEQQKADLTLTENTKRIIETVQFE